MNHFDFFVRCCSYCVTKSHRKTIVDAVGQNENVLFYWSLVSQDIDEGSSELLQLICGLPLGASHWHHIGWRYINRHEKN